MRYSHMGFFAATVAACSLFRAVPAQGQTLRFSGYTWQVKASESEGPGPNHWSAANARVDSRGMLHLKISKKNDVWYCGEVSLTQKLGFGTYQFQVTGRIDQFDKNIVLGLFNYPTPDIGPDGTNEIDIEFAHWGNITYPNGNYTVWPAKEGTMQTSSTFPFTLTGNKTTQRFLWKSDSILFQSQAGYRDDNKQEYGHWLFQPTSPETQIPQKPMPVLMNLWLFQGHPPTDGKEVEIIVSRFKFTPLTTP